MEKIAKETILKNIRKSLLNPSFNPYADADNEKPIFLEKDEYDDVIFADEFIKSGGEFIYCYDYEELAKNLISYLQSSQNSIPICRDNNIREILDAANIEYYSDEKSILKSNISITGCEYLIARTGSIMVSSAQLSGRRLFCYPEIHIVIGYTSQIVHDIKDALNNIKNKYDNNLPSMVTIITGPSRTADIEKTLVKGAHGPKKLVIFLVEDNIIY